MNAILPLSISDSFGNLGTWGIVLLAAAVITIIVGLFKKTLWICIVGVVLGATFMFTQPYVIDSVKEGVSNVFDGAIDPIRDDDYSDMIGQDISEMKPQDDFGNIGN